MLAAEAAQGKVARFGMLRRVLGAFREAPGLGGEAPSMPGWKFSAQADRRCCSRDHHSKGSLIEMVCLHAGSFVFWSIDHGSAIQ